MCEKYLWAEKNTQLSWQQDMKGKIVLFHLPSIWKARPTIIKEALFCSGNRQYKPNWIEAV